MTVSRAQVYNIKLSADQLMVFTCSRAQVQNFSCVVPENIQTPPPKEGNRNWGGGVHEEAISKGVGWILEVFFPGAPSKIGRLFKK